MSFVSGSGTQTRRKEYVLAEPSWFTAPECEELRSTRFERKGPKAQKPDSMTEEVMICHYRAKDGQEILSSPAPLSSIPFDSIRTFRNLDSFPFAFEGDHDVLQWICGLAAESPLARILMKDAMENGWSVAIADLGGNAFEIDTMSQLITLDHYGFTASALGRSAFYRHAVLINFIKALRAAWHEEQVYGFEDVYAPEAMLMLERAMSADVETMAIVAAWELRAAGHSDIWRHMLGSEEGDMAMVFTRAIEKDPAGFYDGSVFVRTFAAWYGDATRLAENDASILEAMDAHLQEGGRFGKSMLKGEAIEQVSLIPGGRAYLDGMGGNIATDPYFVAMHDAINESHLFQIVYDSHVVMVGGVPFRDSRLARKIFPEGLMAALKD